MKRKIISAPITDDINLLLSDHRPAVALNLMGLFLFMTGRIATDRVIFWVDGIFGKFACWLNYVNVRRVPGRILVDEMLNCLSNSNLIERVKILGGPSSIEKINYKLGHNLQQIDFPFLSERELLSYDFKQFSERDIVIIAVASPKQEAIADAIFQETGAKCVCAGGAINMLAGEETPAPKWIVWMGIESVFRLHHEPIRRVKRIIWTLPKGLIGMFKVKLFRG